MMPEENVDIIRAQEVSLKEKDSDTRGELGDTLHFECACCEKRMSLNVEIAQFHRRLSEREFYCDFCLRHRFFTKDSRNFLMLSFRAIPAYYYYAFYVANFGSQKMYYSQISEYIETHARTGLQNPVFYYDPDTFIWFIDFSRVGKGKGKILYEDVLKTVANILVCFNIPMHIANVRMYEVYSRYREALDKFYSQRGRPVGRKLLAPTLSGCGVYENHQNFNTEDTRNFTTSQFVRMDK